MSTQSEKLLQNPAALCNMVRRVAVAAGAITLEYFEDEAMQGIEVKDDGSPVTLADKAAEDHIEKALKDILPGIPFVGEERAALGEGQDITGAEYFWLVDPLDGTREFILGSPDYTVNIALIHNGIPSLGVIYAPARGVLYAGFGGEKSLRWTEETDKEKTIRVRRPPQEGLTVATNFKHKKSEKLDAFLENFKVNKILNLASSLKICAVAEGRADFYPRLTPISEWDTAAGDAILRAAGGAITDMDGVPLTYGKAAEGFRNPPFVASAFDWYAREEREEA